MDVSRRRVGVRCSVVAGSVWESRMKSDEVGGGVKLFSGEENGEEGGNGGTRLKRSQVGGVVAIGKRKTWKTDRSEGLEKSQIQIAKGKPELQKNSEQQCISPDAIKKSPIQARRLKTEGTDKFERSPIQTRKPRSEAHNGTSEVAESGEGPERNLGQLRKSKSDSIKTTNESVADESRNGIDESGGVSGKLIIDNEKNGNGENCKDFGVCQEKVISSSSDNAGVVKSSPVHVDGDTDDEADEGGEEEKEVGEDIDIEMEKRSFDVKEINMHESKVVNEPERKVIVNEPEKQKVVVNEPAPKKALSTTRQFHQKNERPVSVPLPLKQSPPNRKHSTIYQNFSKANSIPKEEEHRNSPQTQNKLQSLVDLIMWRDISRSAFIFGIGTFTIVSSSYAKDTNLSFISAMSYMGLVYLAVIFLYRSLICRGVTYVEDTNYVLGEEEAIWVLRLILPYLNEFLSKFRAMFSGDPGTTIKLAVLLFVLASCGSSITIWKMAKFGFFGVFTVPKICSSYSAQLTAYANFWIRRFRDAWDSCSHKKAVALGIFGLVWNLSSVAARIWSVFVLFVAFKYYQQHYLVRDEWVEDEAGCDETCQEPVGVAMQKVKKGL